MYFMFIGIFFFTLGYFIGLSRYTHLVSSLSSLEEFINKFKPLLSTQKEEKAEIEIKPVIGKDLVEYGQILIPSKRFPFSIETEYPLVINRHHKPICVPFRLKDLKISKLLVKYVNLSEDVFSVLYSSEEEEPNENLIIVSVKENEYINLLDFRPQRD